jgi:glyoxylase-like metal-dependent hydrolase (beta-lactamase superfamily II)
VPSGSLEELAGATMYGGGVELVTPQRDLNDGDEVRVGSRRIEVVHTPGHSPGHLVFALPDEGLLFTGDHVLPKITPNVSAGPLGAPDPLASYLNSLESVRRYGDEVTVLPAHVAQFDGLLARVDELVTHHDRRLEETAACLEAGATTTWDVAIRLPWSRPLDRFPTFLQRAALGETDAHLQRLQASQRAHALDGEPVRWRLSSRAAAS